MGQNLNLNGCDIDCEEAYKRIFMPHSEDIKDLAAGIRLWVLLAAIRCGATLIPYLYCDVCDEVIRFTCSSCSMNTDERIHAYCRNVDTVNNNGIYLEDTQIFFSN